MKKNVLIGILLITNVITLFGLGRASWLSGLWKMEATLNVDYAAKLKAVNDYDKGKRIRLRLKINDEPKGHVDRPIVFDGTFVVEEETGYSSPSLGGQDSPSIQTARIMVDAYNRTMEEFCRDPEKYRQQRAEEIKYWQEHILGKKKSG